MTKTPIANDHSDLPVYADRLACPKCDSILFVRLHRPWYKRLFTRKKHFYCRECATHFWHKAVE